jgi:hypothetical protein
LTNGGTALICHNGKEFSFEYLYDYLSVYNNKTYLDHDGRIEASRLCRCNDCNLTFKKYPNGLNLYGQNGWEIVLNEVETLDNKKDYLELNDFQGYKYIPTDLLDKNPEKFKVEIKYMKRDWSILFLVEKSLGLQL